MFLSCCIHVIISGWVAPGGPMLSLLCSYYAVFTSSYRDGSRLVGQCWLCYVLIMLYSRHHIRMGPAWWANAASVMFLLCCIHVIISWWVAPGGSMLSLLCSYYAVFTSSYQDGSRLVGQCCLCYVLIMLYSRHHIRMGRAWWANAVSVMFLLCCIHVIISGWVAPGGPMLSLLCSYYAVFTSSYRDGSRLVGQCCLCYVLIMLYSRHHIRMGRAWWANAASVMFLLCCIHVIISWWVAPGGPMLSLLCSYYAVFTSSYRDGSRLVGQCCLCYVLIMLYSRHHIVMGRAWWANAVCVMFLLCCIHVIISGWVAPGGPMLYLLCSYYAVFTSSYQDGSRLVGQCCLCWVGMIDQTWWVTLGPLDAHNVAICTS